MAKEMSRREYGDGYYQGKSKKKKKKNYREQNAIRPSITGNYLLRSSVVVDVDLFQPIA
jgi:hypothetical protein